MIKTSKYWLLVAHWWQCLCYLAYNCLIQWCPLFKPLLSQRLKLTVLCLLYRSVANLSMTYFEHNCWLSVVNGFREMSESHAMVPAKTFCGVDMLEHPSYVMELFWPALISYEDALVLSNVLVAHLVLWRIYVDIRWLTLIYEEFLVCPGKDAILLIVNVCSDIASLFCWKMFWFQLTSTAGVVSQLMVAKFIVMNVHHTYMYTSVYGFNGWNSSQVTITSSELKCCLKLCKSVQYIQVYIYLSCNLQQQLITSSSKYSALLCNKAYMQLVWGQYNPWYNWMLSFAK